MKYSSNGEMNESLPYKLFMTPYKFSPTHLKKLKNNNHSFISLINNLSKSFNAFYETTMKIYQEINNNNLTLSNQILFIQYLLSVIRNKININANINNEIEKLSNHLEKMNYNKKSIDKNFLIINNTCINYHNDFHKIFKKLKNITIKNRYESMKRSRNNNSDDINSDINNFNHFFNFNNDYYSSCKTSIDKDSNLYNSNNLYLNINNRYSHRNTNLMHSFEKKKIKRISYDNNYFTNNRNLSTCSINSAVFKNRDNNNNKHKKIRFFNSDEKIYFNEENNNNLNRCSSVSNLSPNISNIINNFYNRDTYYKKNEKNNNKDITKSNKNKTNIQKIELELALKVISFIKLMNKIEKDIENNNSNINENNQNLNELKYYIVYLSKNIIKKYKKNNEDNGIDNLTKNNNNINIDNNNTINNNKKYEKLLIEFKKSFEKIHNIEKENNIIKNKYKELSQNYNILKQKYNDILKINEKKYKKISPHRQTQTMEKNNNFNVDNDNKLLLSKKLTDITKLSHQNSVFLLEMNKLQKEKESLLKKMGEKDKYIKSLINNNTHITKKENNNKNISKKLCQKFDISSNSFSIIGIKTIYTNKKEISSLYNTIKTKDENIEKLNKEINIINDNNLKIKEEILQKNTEIEDMNKKIDELNTIINNNEIKIQKLVEEQKDTEKNNKEKIDNLINNNIKLKMENEEYINTNDKNINEINNQNNIINELQKQLKEYSNNNNESNKNKSNKNISIINMNNNELLKFSVKEEKDIMTPSFLSPDRNYNNNSIEANPDSNDLKISSNKNLINDYESKIKLLKESNIQLTKEIIELKNEKNSKKIYKPEEYLIICDKNKDGLRWFLIKNKKYAKDKSSYNNMFWVDNNCISDIKKYNKFKSEEDETNEIIINNVKKLEEKEDMISKLSYRINCYENLNNSLLDIYEDPKDVKKAIQKSKSEKSIKNIKNTNNSKNNVFSSKVKFNAINDFEQNLNDNIKDDYSKNQYFYLEGNGLGLLNNFKDHVNYK